MSEWGNPTGANARSGVHEHIVYVRETRGTETSKYPQEKKSKEIPLVVASESGRGQTCRREPAWGYGLQNARKDIVE